MIPATTMNSTSEKPASRRQRVSRRFRSMSHLISKILHQVPSESRIILVLMDFLARLPGSATSSALRKRYYT